MIFTLFVLPLLIGLLFSCYNHVAEYISQRQPLGGLLFLLPQIFNFENKEGDEDNNQDHDTELMKNVLIELEQLLVHSNLPVS